MSSFVSDIRGTRVMTGLVPALYDRVDISYPDTVTEIYAFSYDSNAAGTVVLIYSDATKSDLISAERTA